MPDSISIGVIGLYHETNTFAPGRTDTDAFRLSSTTGRDAFMTAFAGTKTTMGGVIDASQEEQVQLLPGVYASATPSGIVSQEAAEQLIQSLAASVPPDIDGLMIILHGAMVSEQHDDMEEALLRAVRARVRETLPIAVTVDLHANLDSGLLRLCDMIVGYDTYPHIDACERGAEALHLLVSRIRGDIRPVMAMARPRMLVAPQRMVTSEGAMRELMDAAFRMEKDPGVLNVTICGGFPYSDIPHAGMSFIVTTDGNAALAERYAEELKQLAWSRREQFRYREHDGVTAIEEAARADTGPVIVVEGSDNVGGGAPADGTHLLPALLAQNVPSLMVIRDLEAVALACQAGVGGELRCRVGGKSDQLHGSPVPIEGRVRLLSDGAYRHRGPYMTGTPAFMGRTAVVAVNQVTLVLTEERVPPWDIGHIASLGLEPDAYRIIVVKSAVAWRSAFGSYAKQVIEADTPGCCTASLHRLPYRQLSRPLFPFDEPANTSVNAPVGAGPKKERGD
ncbi:M81 family metallopeptidase [Paenibacillus sp. GCM10023250]|uniref:M81 family metallopeptidase n=1 Tax=Paenibacillus sp. GCM10023250 TaxID=3252648 RepID=UPI0036125959